MMPSGDTMDKLPPIQIGKSVNQTQPLGPAPESTRSACGWMLTALGSFLSSVKNNNASGIDVAMTGYELNT